MKVVTVQDLFDYHDKLDERETLARAKTSKTPLDSIQDSIDLEQHWLRHVALAQAQYQNPYRRGPQPSALGSVLGGIFGGLL